MTIQSNQPLGETTVLVECDESLFSIAWVYVFGFEVPARCFSDAQCNEWSKAIQAEYESAQVDREEYARELAAERVAEAREAA